MNESILLIEDEQAFAPPWATVCERKVISWKRRGRNEGFEKASNQPFDLIILDLMLPRRSGLDVCRDLRHGRNGNPHLDPHSPQ